MKFNELKLRFDEPNIWKYHPTEKNNRGMTFHEVFKKQHAFGKMKEEIKDRTVSVISNAIDAADSDEQIGLNLDPVFERFSKSFFCNDTINGDLLMKKANKNTLNKKLQSWCDQLNRNIPIVRKSPGAAIFYDKFKGVPAVVVCAGPSLKNSIEKLRQLKGKALIITTDTAFRSLMKRGIEPDFMNAHDANENGARFFQGVKTKCVGLMVNYVNPKIIQAYLGPKSFYYVKDDSIGTYTTMAHACDSPDRKDGTFLNSGLTGGSSVAHTAYYLALEMGCSAVTFVGLDLSFPDLDNSHFETDNPKDVRAQKLIPVECITGETVQTNLSFYSYKHVFDRMSGFMAFNNHAEVFTSSEDDEGRITGIVHEGLRPLHLDKFIEKYATVKRPEIDNISSIYDKFSHN